MEDYIVVQNLIEILSAIYLEGIPLKKDLNYSLTTEFLQNMKCVLITKQMVVKHKWEQVFKICSHKMSTPEKHLRYVIYACRQYAYLNLHIFDRFINVFALLIDLRVATFDNISVNLSKLIPDIFMGLYESELKKSFGRCGGFCRFVEYINNPIYLALNSARKLVSVKETFDALDEQINRLLREEYVLPDDFRLEEADIDRPSITLAQKILKSSKVELPSFPPSGGDMNAKLGDRPQQMVEQLAEEKRVLEEKARALEEVLEQCSNLYPRTNDGAGQMANNAQFEDIIQAVIRYNRSNSSNHANKDNRSQEEAWEILEHLKNKIITLIDFLDEYDKE